MRDYERNLIGQFLEELSDHQGNAGCNDWKMPSTMSEDDKIHLLKAYKEEYDDPDWDVNVDDYLIDHIVVDVLKNALFKDTLKLKGDKVRVDLKDKEDGHLQGRLS